MHTNQKGFVNIVLIVLIVVLAGVLGYITLMKTPAPAEQSHSNNLQNTQSITPPTPNNTVSKSPLPAQPPVIQMSQYISSLKSSPLPKSAFDASSWIEYKDKENGFSFRYDPRWKISKVTGSVADNVLIIMDDSLVSIGINPKNQTLEELVRSRLNERCNGCVHQEPIVYTMPNGNYVVEVFAYDKYNKIDMHPGTFYFENNRKQFLISTEGSSASKETMTILNTLEF